MTMPVSRRRQVEVYRTRPLVLGVAVFASLLLQTVLPLTFPRARFFDLPLLVVIYFSLLRRSKLFGIGLGTAVGLLQDALSHHYMGLYGMSKALVAYLAASASVKFDLEQLLARFILAGILVLIHGAFLLGLAHALLETPPPFVPLDLATSVLSNMAVALPLFYLLDRFKRPV
jgi:rod shape-determining protein MreD